MRITIGVVVCLLVVSLGVSAQNNAKPEFLVGPASWQFERFALPPSFSTTFPYKGVEELRFSPGMFNKDSTNYFSYAFIARLDNTTAFTGEDVKNYLLIYFKGLCASTAKQRNLTIDTSQIKVSLEKSNSGPSTYNAVLNLFGVFADGAPVTLNAEIKVLSDSNGQKTYLVYIASPQKKTHEIWRQLYEIQKGFTLSGRIGG
jgi:hypothetical protein